MSDGRVEAEHRVTPLELFFDLVFVFAFTRVTTFLSRLPTWGGLLRGLLILAVLWWAWSSYAWLTNTFDPEEGLVRLVVLSAAAAMVVASLAVPCAIGAALLGFVVAAALWWSYFDWFAYVAQSRLAEATGEKRAQLARDAFSYLHLPMVAGIVLFAFGLKTALPDVSRTLPTVPAFCLVGGIALYLLGHVAVRLRVGGGFGRGRPVAAVVLLAMLPGAMNVSALAALGLVAAVCVALIVYEFFRHRESRAWIRSHHGEPSREEAAELDAREMRRHRGGPTETERAE